MEPVSSTSDVYAGPDDVPCDVCADTKLRAQKTCLTCMASYCETHLQPHRVSAALRRHKLEEPNRTFEEKLCGKHQKVLEIFCRTDGICVCYLCVATEHKNHDTVTPSEERARRQSQLEKRRAEMKKRIKEKEQKLEAMQESLVKILSFKTPTAEASEPSRDHEWSLVRMADDLIKQLEKEIRQLKRRDAELAELSQTDDHIYFLKRFPSLCVPLGDEDTQDVNVNGDLLPETLRLSLSDLKKSLQEISDWEFVRASQTGGDIIDCILRNLSIENRLLKGDNRCPRLSDLKVHLNDFDKPCTLTCIVSDFYPKEINVTWLRREKQTQKTDIAGSSDWMATVSHSGPTLTDNKYSLVSQAEFSPQFLSDLEDMEFTCRVEHQTLKEVPIEKSTSVISALRRPPTVAHIQMKEYKGFGQTCTLQCSIQDFYPKDIMVTWLQAGGSEGRDIRAKAVIPVKEKRGYKLDAVAEFTPHALSDLLDISYICIVHHEALDAPVEKRLGRFILKYLIQEPTVSDVKVHFTKFGQPCTLSCVVSDFYPKEISVNWMRKKKGFRRTVQAGSVDWKASVHHYGPLIKDNRYSLVSQVDFTPVTLSDFEGMEFICRVEHESLKQKIIEKSCSVIPGLHRRPLVSDICVSKTEQLGKVRILSCSIQDFYPKDITVTWKCGSDGVNICPLPSEPQKEQYSYNFESKAIFTHKTLNDEKGITYFCRVEHTTLNGKPIEKQTRRSVVPTLKQLDPYFGK